MYLASITEVEVYSFAQNLWFSVPAGQLFLLVSKTRNKDTTSFRLMFEDDVYGLLLPSNNDPKKYYKEWFQEIKNNDDYKDFFSKNNTKYKRAHAEPLRYSNKVTKQYYARIADSFKSVG